MKKSECFKKAQIAVVNSLVLTGEEKIEIIRVLMEEEKLSAFIEKENEEKGALKNVCF